MNGKNSSLLRLLLVALLLFAIPETAGAHAAISGVGDFFGGVLHPFTTPAHVLVLLGLGLFVGQHSPLNLKPSLAVFIPVSAAALLLTTTGIVKTVYPPILISIALIAGVMVALEKSPPAIVSGVISPLRHSSSGWIRRWKLARHPSSQKLCWERGLV